MYSSEIEHVMMHLWRMEREVKNELWSGTEAQHETRFTFLIALGEVQRAMLRFRKATGSLSTDNLT